MVVQEQRVHYGDRFAKKRPPNPKEIEAAINLASLTAATASWREGDGNDDASATGVQLSARLTTLRQQLEESEAYMDWKHLEEMRILGGGSFATVTKCMWTPPQGLRKVVAVKQIKTELLGDQSEVQAFVDEARLLKKLKHRYIVEFYGCGWLKATEDNESVHWGKPICPLPTQQQLFFVQECLDGGNLQQLVVRAMTNQGCKVYSDKDALRWSWQITQALEFMHTRSSKVVHRDLKLENILLDSHKASRANAKLADFGLARRLHGTRQSAREKSQRLEHAASTSLEDLEPERSVGLQQRLSAWMAQPNLAELVVDRSYHAQEMTTRAGSMGYIAPEVLRGQPYNERADVFSFGIILYNLFHWNIPTLHIMLHGTFKDLEAYAHQVAHGFRQEISDKVAPGVRSLIERCWRGDPKLRPSMAQVAAELERLQAPVEESDTSQGCACSIM